jgi:hypothetical protein
MGLWVAIGVSQAYMDQWEQTFEQEAVFQASTFITEGTDLEQWQTKMKGPFEGNPPLQCIRTFHSVKLLYCSQSIHNNQNK